jgi:hypothetical protein
MSFKQFLFEDISNVKELDKALDDISKGIKDVKISKHFVDRIQDRSINLKDIANTIEKFFKKYEHSLNQASKKELSGIIKNMLSHLNIAISYDTNGTTNDMSDDILTLVTVMKKKGFVSNSFKDIIYRVK